MVRPKDAIIDGVPSSDKRRFHIMKNASST
jgi:hypothetical protein